MKFFTTLLTLGLIGTSVAEPMRIAKRGADDYKGVITTVSDQVAVVDKAVADYVGGSAKGDAVVTASDKLNEVINTGKTNVEGFDPLSSTDALAIVKPIETLTDDVGALVDAVIAAKPNFDKDSLSEKVSASLKAQKESAQGLADAITAKVPDALKDMAKELSAGIAKHIQRGIDAYA